MARGVIVAPVNASKSPPSRRTLQRCWGGYPDGVAFAVLLMNLSVPLIDRYTIPRIYGHAR